MKSRRALRLGLGLSLAAVAAVELGLRVFVLPEYWRPLPPFQAVMTGLQREWLERQQEELAGRRKPEGIGQFDADLGWSYKRSARDPVGPYTIHAGGWRGTRDYPVPAAPGITRLAAFGESFTFCHDVPDEASWEAQLEGLDAGVQAVNFGVGGYGTDQALLLAEKELPRLGAHLVTVGLLLENIGRNVTRYRPLWAPQSNSPVAKPRFVLEGGELALVPLPFRERGEFLEAVADGSVLELLKEHEYWSDQPVPSFLTWSATARLIGAKLAYDRRKVPEVWAAGGEPVEVTLAILARFRELARKAGAKDALVLIFPAQLDLKGLVQSGAKYWTPLLARLEGVPHIDLSDALAEAAREGGVGQLYGPGQHLSKVGNAIVAKTLLAWLKAQG